MNREPQWRFQPSGIELFCLLGGILLALWYAWIMDDAYVYFRYVDNWVIYGLGLVWNEGEYVEGFSSPLWCLFLALLRALHLDYWMIIRGVGVLCFALFWYMLCVINRGFLSPDKRADQRIYNIPMIYLSFSYPVLCYFSSGLESPFVNLVAVFYAASILWPQAIFLQCIVGLTPLVRQEFVLPFLLFVCWCIFFKKIRPTAALFIFVVSSGSYGLFRVWYFADFFPNTFYLKDITWISQGINYLYDALLPYFVVPYLLGMWFIYRVLLKKDEMMLQGHERVMMILLSASVAMYVIKIGGDARHFRYLAFPYILSVVATGGLIERAVGALSPISTRYVPALLLVFALAVSLCYPRQLQQHPIFRAQFNFAHTQFLLINDAAAHRLNSSGITPPPFVVNSELGYASAKKRFELGLADQLSRRAAANVNGHQSSIITVMRLGWCQTAYLAPASFVVHAAGLTEPFLARTRMISDRPAHKNGLEPLSENLVSLRNTYGFGPGVFDKAVTDGVASKWIRDNIGKFRRIESKIYNEHNLHDNFVNAITPVGLIEP